jgi:phosphoribosyl-ATP pyrophosphohydrolase
MKDIRTAIRRRKIDPRNDPADAGHAFSVRAAKGEQNGLINIAASLSGFDGSALGTSSRQSAASAQVLEQLYRELGRVTAAAYPRTFKLLQSGDRKLARKVIEEACEVTVEAVKHDADGVIRESADLLYHLVVLWCRIGIEPIEIWREMQSRADTARSENQDCRQEDQAEVDAVKCLGVLHLSMQ